MDIATTTPFSTTPAAPAAPPAAPRSETSALSSDFETFLRMLTVQMKNQDPLNPVEATDFAVQLATFSGVEQQVQTNNLLTSLGASLAGAGMADLAGWIGKEVRTAGAALFSGAPLTLYPGEMTGGADRTLLAVRDETGLTVARLPVTGTETELTWAGVRPDGTPMPPGLYRFEIERMVGEEVVGTVPVEHYAPVSEVRTAAAGPELLLPGGATVAVADVRAVRPAA